MTAATQSDDTINVLRNRKFLALWIAQVVTQVGGNMVLYGLTVIVVEATSSNSAVSALILTFLLPAVLFSALAGVFGMTMAIANERWFGTLPAILATPANRVALFAGRFLPFVFNGLLVSIYALVIGIIFLEVRLEPGSLAVVGLALLTTVFSCTSIGALQGAISLRLRDGLFGANLIMMGVLLFCGVNIPLSALPPWMQVVSQLLPFTHGLEAVRQAADGAGLRQVGGLIAIEFAIGVLYAVAAFALFSYLERSARQNATLDVR